MHEKVTDPLARHINNNIDILVDTMVSDGVAAAACVLLLLAKLIWPQIIVSFEIIGLTIFFVALSFYRSFKSVKNLNGGCVDG